MSTFLEKILADVRAELATAKQKNPGRELRARLADAPPPRPFHAALSAPGFGLIAEIKERSPSVGPMRAENVAAAPAAYAASPIVRAVSVLTNHTHFGMDIHRLAAIRAKVPQPVLRKDFFIDDHQVLEARAFGADAILLMANVLDTATMARLHALALSLGMEALFEIHTAAEIATLPPAARIVGINSRKFQSTTGFVATGSSSSQDFSLDTSAFALVDQLPAHSIKVAESGLAPEGIPAVAEKFQAALVGTTLLRDERGIAASLADFAKQIPLNR
ncbi:MAG: indole-3-glycerol phosphate synthase TrpC [Verrucomicrobia bacterium]|nr:indole-3-glycerol phosphate synthase TrpC [Verrucomicrobiota bacterium]